MHKGKYVNFLGKETEAKQNICKYLLSNNVKREKICDICGDNYDDNYDISQVSQAVYPAATGSLKSQCGIRKLEQEYHSCPKCAF